ncbi:ABC transporter substrate-binding protein [Streptomyces sp. NPDC050560]|uniref:ABC transporter substrate-binding protein n=1 Tax=Streptomyces sp. NPDC050560 TaxID=3365630 RepID=UPI00379EE7BD
MKAPARLPRALAAATAMVMGLSLAACGNSDSDSGGGDDTIHVLVYGDAANKVEKDVIEEFNKTSKVKAVLDTIPGADYQSKLQTIINTKQAPDVFYNWGGGSIKPFVKAGLLMPLDDMMAKNPKLKSMFLPSVLDAAKVDDKYYGIPMRGTQPVLLFHNKKVLKDAGVSAPKTWDDLLGAVDRLKDKGVTPISLGGGDKWPTLMWFEYIYDRVAGPDLLKKALDGDKDVWNSPESKKALQTISDLEKTGAFGKNYDSVKQTDGGSAQLLTSDKAGFELMGSWEFSTINDNQPDFAAKQLGYSTFPTVPGGKGDPKDLVGNTNNYYSVMKNATHPEAIAKFLELMYSDHFVNAQLGIGNLPTTTNAGQKLTSSNNATYLKYQYDRVADAPAFQLSWDQAYTQDNSTPLQTAIQQFFNGSIDQDGFIKAMQGLSTS